MCCVTLLLITLLITYKQLRYARCVINVMVWFSNRLICVNMKFKKYYLKSLCIFFIWCENLIYAVQWWRMKLKSYHLYRDFKGSQFFAHFFRSKLPLLPQTLCLLTIRSLAFLVSFIHIHIYRYSTQTNWIMNRISVKLRTLETGSLTWLILFESLIGCI